jgi:hypothetical protein
MIATLQNFSAGPRNHFLNRLYSLPADQALHVRSSFRRGTATTRQIDAAEFRIGRSPRVLHFAQQLFAVDRVQLSNLRHDCLELRVRFEPDDDFDPTPRSLERLALDVRVVVVSISSYGRSPPLARE